MIGHPRSFQKNPAATTKFFLRGCLGNLVPRGISAWFSARGALKGSDSETFNTATTSKEIDCGVDGNISYVRLN